MNLRENLEKLAEIDCDGVLTMSPDPNKAAVTYRDGVAGRLLLWLADVLPDDATTSDVEDVLISALYWHIHFLTMRKARRLEVVDE